MKLRMHLCINGVGPAELHDKGGSQTDRTKDKT